MRSKITAFLAILLFAFLTSVGVSYAHGGSGGDDRVRIEVRTGEDEPEENRVRVELRGEGASAAEALNLVQGLDLPDEIGRLRIEERDGRVRVEVRGPEAAEVEEVEALPNFEIEGNTFEVTGEVTSFTGGTVTVGGHTISINPGAVANFEQEGTIEVGEVIKVEGFVAADGSLLAREVKADGLEVEVEDEVTGASLTSLLNQILAFFQSLMQT